MYVWIVAITAKKPENIIAVFGGTIDASSAVIELSTVRPSVIRFRIRNVSDVRERRILINRLIVIPPIPIAAAFGCPVKKIPEIPIAIVKTVRVINFDSDSVADVIGGGLEVFIVDINIYIMYKKKVGGSI